ncbi:MAG: hypothetical protein KAX05_05210 [Bacteroidales bacterium]|nr:hypothetical protein [Bacteroidales bacterium]
MNSPGLQPWERLQKEYIGPTTISNRRVSGPWTGTKSLTFISAKRIGMNVFMYKKGSIIA